MQKQTKNIITREFIEKELRFYNTADIRYTLVLCVVLSLLFVPLTVCTVYGILSIPEHVLGKPVQILLSILIGCLTSLPIWFMLFSLGGSLAERALLQKGEFEIISCQLLYKSERRVSRHMEEFLHFAGFKETSVGHTHYQLAAPGDEFYIVHYRTKTSIKQCYSSKIYEYREC